MGITEQKNCVKSINSKIPEYARDYKKEYLVLRGIDKMCFNFISKYETDNEKLFYPEYYDSIKYFIKRFLKGQERGKLQDISNFEIESSVVDNLIKINKNFLNFNQYINFCKICFDEDDGLFIDPYPGFKNIYDDFELFFSKFKIKYEEGTSFSNYYSDSDSESESDGVNSDDLDDIISDSESESDSD